MANVPRPPSAMTPAERKVLQDVSGLLYRMERLKRDLLTCDPNDAEQSDRLSAELLALLGLNAAGS